MTKDQRPLWANTWLWLAVGAGIYLLTRKTAKSNPRMPDELPEPYGSGREYLELANPAAYSVDASGRRSDPKVLDMNPVAPCIMGHSLPSLNPNVNGLAISPGNTKMGYIWNWSMTPGPPPIGTCPGATDWCKMFCYAHSGKSRMMVDSGKGVHGDWWHNQQASERDDFAPRMIDALKRIGRKEFERSGLHGPKPGGIVSDNKTFNGKVFRIHVGGDFYSINYIKKWIQIVDAMHDWYFYAYTRSWRVPELLPWIEELKKRRNVIIKGSTDPTGYENLPIGWAESGVVRVYRRPAIVCKALNASITDRRREQWRVSYRLNEDVTIDPIMNPSFVGEDWPGSLVTPAAKITFPQNVDMSKIPDDKERAKLFGHDSPESPYSWASTDRRVRPRLGDKRRVIGEKVTLNVPHYEMLCADCGFCFNPERRTYSIAFPVHSVPIKKWPDHIEMLKSAGWTKEAELAELTYQEKLALKEKTVHDVARSVRKKTA